MIDLGRLNEAIEYWSDGIEDGCGLADDQEQWSVLIAAACAYRDLLANGERRSAFWSVDSYVINKLQAGEYVVIPVQLLVDYPTEED